MTERFRRVNYGNLEIVITFEDPPVYTQPFTVKVNQRIMPDTDLIEFICNENDRSGPHLVGKSRFGSRLKFNLGYFLRRSLSPEVRILALEAKHRRRYVLGE